MHIKLLALFLVPTFQALAMGTNKPEKNINPLEINQLNGLTDYGKYCVKECLHGDFQACKQVEKEPGLMKKINGQHPQIAAGLYLQLQKAQKYNREKQLIEKYLKERKACFEKNSPSGCKFIIEHQEALKKLNVLNNAQLNQAKDTMGQMRCPFFSE
ncbi:MAG TPA: hypothetical protein VHO47_00170 [Candidatus Babeliales bacterium]|nr:hypothetical protein [Candidatus Babeliales bacterium]